MAGEPETADAGLFGPGSLTWRVHSEPILIIAGLRALLLQALHPLAMAGIAQHSTFREDPWGRLLRTAEYVGVTSFGPTAEVQAAAARVRGVHRGLGGIEPESGRRYQVSDPALLLWVHCCEVDSFLTCYLRSGHHLSAAEVDAYLGEQRRSAALVGLDPADVPACQAELAAYFAARRPELRVTAAAREAAAYVLWPPMPRWVAALTPARPAWLAVAVEATALLPGWARRMYGWPGLPGTELAAGVALRLLSRGLAVLPGQLREGPQLRAARRRTAPAGPAAPAGSAGSDPPPGGG